MLGTNTHITDFILLSYSSKLWEKKSLKCLSATGKIPRNRPYIYFICLKSFYQIEIYEIHSHCNFCSYIHNSIGPYFAMFIPLMVIGSVSAKRESARKNVVGDIENEADSEAVVNKCTVIRWLVFPSVFTLALILIAKTPTKKR